MLPGDVATSILGQWATPHSLDVLRQQLGLYRPAYVRYAEWIGHFVVGNWGVSLTMNEEVRPLVLHRLSNSFVLAAIAFGFIVPLSVGMGVVAGLKRGRWPDTVISVVGLAGLALPEFVLGVLLMMLFSLWLKVLPPSSSIPPDSSPLGNMKALVLPTLALSLVIFGYLSRMTRISLVGVMGSDFVRTAVLKGLPSGVVVVKHALRNALLPSITVTASLVGWLLGGLVVVESLFSYPGLGSLLMEAALHKDIPVLEAVGMVIALVYACSNLVADLLYAFVNPQIRYD